MRSRFLACLAIATLVGTGCGRRMAGSSPSEPPTKLHSEVTFKDSRWVVLSAENLGKSVRGKSGKEETTTGKFVLVRFKVMNTTKKEERITNTPKLVDAAGREYETWDKQVFHLPVGSEPMGGKALPAGIEKEFASIYEVPADATGLKFQARGLGLIHDKKLVDLALDSSPTPESK